MLLCPQHAHQGGPCLSEICKHRNPHEEILGCISGPITHNGLDIVVSCPCRTSGKCEEVGGELSIESVYAITVEQEVRSI